MTGRLVRLYCRLRGHSGPVTRDYDLNGRKVLIDRCGRCNALLGHRESLRVPYPRRRLT